MPIELISPTDDKYIDTVKRHNAQPRVGANRRLNAPVYEDVALAYNAAQVGVVIRFNLAGRVTSGNVVKVLENRGLKAYVDFEVSRDTSVEAEHPAELPVVLLKLTDKPMKLMKPHEHAE